MQKNNDKNTTFHNFWELMKPYRRLSFVLLIFIIFLEVIRLIGPYILKILVDELLVFSNDRIYYLLQLIFAFVFSLAIISIVDHIKDRKIFKVLISAERDIPVRCQEKLLSLDLGYFQEEGTGDKLAKIEKGAFKFTDLLGTIFWELLPVGFQFISTSVILLFIDYRLFLILLVFSIILIVLNIRTNKNVYPARKDRYKKYEQASGKMIQSIMNINTVQSFSQEKREIDELRGLKQHIYDVEKKEWFYILKFANLREVLVGLGRGIFMLFGIFLVIKGQISVGTLVFVITLSEKVFGALSRAYRLYDRFAEGSEGINRLAILLNTESKIRNNGKLKLKKVEGNIVFKDVNFSYKESGLVLNNFNLNIPADSLTALVGPSGGGKTTIIKLIFRHFDPISGQILLDNHNLKDIDLFNLRKFLAIVPQEVEIFNSSILENINYANKKASRAETEAAAKIANASEFIDKLPNKYETIVGERGIKLSGGQRQRIGIARAILANPKVLVFDEATSNLDTESEKLIQDAIFKIARNKTIIIIAHRLSTVKMCDKIVVIEDGQVAEEGMHLHLLNKKDGLYRKLSTLQSLGDLN
ncbi:MAG TPA: ABC transporter ATP-binding protein [bacterium]|nr:ABC transporter ATP-binding protein [bacterium]